MERIVTLDTLVHFRDSQSCKLIHNFTLFRVFVLSCFRDFSTLDTLAHFFGEYRQMQTLSQELGVPGPSKRLPYKNQIAPCLC
jgi:hypothetical protein